MLNKKTLVFLTVIFFLMAQLPLFSKANSVYNETIKKSESSVFFVGGNGTGNYTKIQDAIDNATNGDTIFVFSGIYYENIVIDKSIYLIGENKFKTILDGSIKGDTVSINAENVTVQGFTITNATGSGIYNIFKAGIRIIGSHNTIKSNIIKNNNVGLFTRRVTNITILENEFYNNAITLSPYDVEESNISISKEYFIHTIENNTVNGKKILYLKNQKNIKIQAETGQLITFNCSNITIQNISFTKCDFALLMTYTDNCKINNSQFIDDADIWLMQCNHNIFEYNKMAKNFHGITLDYSSKHNTLRHNNFSENQLMGVMIETRSNFNIIEKNNLIKNNYSNAFIKNSFRNKWNKNYWDDWVGLKHPILRFLPKTIFCSPFKIISIIAQLNFDLCPVEEPYEI